MSVDQSRTSATATCTPNSLAPVAIPCTPNGLASVAIPNTPNGLAAVAAPRAPGSHMAIEPAIAARPSASDHTGCVPEPVIIDRTICLPTPVTFDRAPQLAKPTDLEHSRRSQQSTAPDGSADARPPSSPARDRSSPRSSQPRSSQPRSPAAVLAASGGTILFGAAAKLRPPTPPTARPAARTAPPSLRSAPRGTPATAPAATAAPTAARIHAHATLPDTISVGVSVTKAPATPVFAPVTKASSAVGPRRASADDEDFDPGDTVELRSEIIAALIAESMTMKHTAPPAAQYASPTRVTARYQAVDAPPVSSSATHASVRTQPVASAGAISTSAGAAFAAHTAADRDSAKTLTLPLSASSAKTLVLPPSTSSADEAGPDSAGSVGHSSAKTLVLPPSAGPAAHTAASRDVAMTLVLPPSADPIDGADADSAGSDGRSSAVTLELPLSAVRSRRRGPVNARARAEAIAPAHAASPVDPASIWWGNHSSSRTPPSSQTPPGPWSWRRPRAPRVTLVIFLLVASLFCALFAPSCWIVANTELDGIERGTVEDRHRGLLGLARLWGVFVTCLLSVICLFVLYGLVQSSAHSL